MNKIIEMSEDIKKDLKHKQYGLYGKHSAVEICEWNKKAIRGQGVCYKQKFYNVDCHRCAQISASVMWCDQNCIFCWRLAQNMQYCHLPTSFTNKPKDIIDNLFEERKKLLSGFGGYKDVDKKIFKEAQTPTHVAISLSGEGLLYDDLPLLIKELKSRKEIKTIFLVTNGLYTKMLKRLQDEDALPTQLYLSIESPNEELQKKINRPKIKNAFKHLMETINYLPKLKCRKVVRFTLIKGINDDLKYLKDFVKLFEKSKTDFLEVKSYMFLGESRKNLKIENMPSHQDCLNYSKEIEKVSKDFKIVDESKPSRIVLLKNKNSKYKNFIK